MADIVKKYQTIGVHQIRDFAQLNAASDHNATVEGRPSNASEKTKLIKERPKDNNFEEGVYLIEGEADASIKLKQLIDKHGLTIRKSGTNIAAEFVISFSKESQPKDLNKWIDDTVGFIKNKYGKENFLQATLHTDETTPHLHIMIAPIIKKEQYRKERMVFGYTDLFGGKKAEARKKLQQLHDDYSEVTKAHGLERGRRGGPAKHKTIKEFYRDMNQVSEKHEPLPPVEKIAIIKPAIKKPVFGPPVVPLEDFNKLKGQLTQARSELRQERKDHEATRKTITYLEEEVRKKDGHIEKLKSWISERGIKGLLNTVAKLKEKVAGLQQGQERHAQVIAEVRKAHAEQVAEIRHDHKQEIESWRLGLGGKPIDQVPKVWLEKARREAAERERIQTQRPDNP